MPEHSLDPQIRSFAFFARTKTKNNDDNKTTTYKPSAGFLFGADREEPGGVNKHGTFRDAQRSYNNVNDFVFLEGQKGSFTVRKLVHGTQSISQDLGKM